MVIHYIKYKNYTSKRDTKFIDTPVHRIQSNLDDLQMSESNRKAAHRNNTGAFEGRGMWPYK